MNENSSRNSKNIFNHHFTFPILAKIQCGFRPSQIAEQLGVNPQAVHYHTDRMIKSDLIVKDKDEKGGIRWKVKEKGILVLKQKATGSVNSFNNYQTRPVARFIPTRLDNLSFAFKILSQVPEDLDLRWSKMKNRVSKCCLKYDTHAVELVKSEAEGDGSVILVHMGKRYCIDSTKELVKLSYLALHYAQQAAIQFRIEISERGYLIKRPHFAFEEDLVALFIAASQTAEINTKEEEEGGRAWIDSSNGVGEIETNDPHYAYLYLNVPKTVDEIADRLRHIAKRVNYERFYHPLYTTNN